MKTLELRVLGLFLALWLVLSFHFTLAAPTRWHVFAGRMIWAGGALLCTSLACRLDRLPLRHWANVSAFSLIAMGTSVTLLELLMSLVLGFG